MTTYNLSKGPNNDTNGQVLREWISNNYENITNLTIKDIGAATIEDMSYISSPYSENEFLSCVDISMLNTAKVTTVCSMFTGCYNLTNISNFNTSNVNNMSKMFSDCHGLTNIPNFDTSNVTNMQDTFSQCTGLTNIPNFDTSNVIDMSTTFIYCSNLTTIPNFNTSNVSNMNRMFRRCTSLVDVPEFNTSNVTDIEEMFSDCNNLSNESIQNIVNMCINSNITTTEYMNLSNANPSSPLYFTKFNSSYYSNRLTDLTNAGWAY